MVAFDDVYFVVYVIVFCVVNVCMLPQPGKNSYANWYEFKSKITIIDKLQYIQLAIEYLQFKYTDSDIKNIEKRCERAMKWLKQRVKHYSKRIREQRARSYLRGEETVEFSEDPATFYESLEVKST